MILTVTLNAALDVTYRGAPGRLGRRQPGRRRTPAGRRQGRQRGPRAGRARPGGAGHRPGGRADRRGGSRPTCRRPGCRRRWWRSPPTRAPRWWSRTLQALLTVRGPRCSTSPGRRSRDDEFGDFGRFTVLLATARAVVLSGSLPRGVPADAYATTGRPRPGQGRARHRGRRRRAAAPRARGPPRRSSSPTPRNSRRAVPEGTRGGRPGTARSGCRVGGRVAWASAGCWRSRPKARSGARMPYTVEGNPTGAGDSLVAGLALGLVQPSPWHDTLQDGGRARRRGGRGAGGRRLRPRRLSDIHPLIEIA